jgi:NAD(P)-dependent dehydrogenase (short-subunit alcohol dehydrogenase family)
VPRSRHPAIRTFGAPPVSAVVTGGASGIGLAAARRLKEARHAAVVWDIKGGDITCTPMLAKPEQLPGWAEAIFATLEIRWATWQVIHAGGGLGLHSPIDVFRHIQRMVAPNTDRRSP